ncbi:protein of unknown function [Kyrpidia spormannii]|uniref:Uncharacterized protein n=2 Tax=Kyrpidia spormannii TaxID=2055160 RepID=A0ACA8Z541_9BACL|nr:protein of unknown function [Kyrpidia spormannii]CAB3390428.1 protein of unknown function [Kyrpidia spormannii]
MQLPGVTVEVHKLEAAPLVAYLCRELRVAEIIDAHVTWDRHRTEVSPGTAITALLVNLLVRGNHCTGSSGSSGTWMWRPCSAMASRPATSMTTAWHGPWTSSPTPILGAFITRLPWDLRMPAPSFWMSFGWTPPPFPSKAATIPPTSRMRLFGSPEDTARTCVRTSSSFSLGWGVTAVFPYSLM